MLAECAPIGGERAGERRMRTAVSRAKKTDDFAKQQAFDQALADRVAATAMPAEINQWFANEKLATPEKKSWLSTARHPAILATAIALAVIAVIAWIKFDEQMHAFPGMGRARKLLVVASNSRTSQLDPVQTDAGTLGDLFFMKYRLEHYDVPEEFGQLRTVGCRVFDDDEAGRVAQIGTAERRLQLFLFPAERDPKSGQPVEFEGWRYLEQEGWTGAVRAKNGVLFMAAVHGPKKELVPYLPKESAR
ncbi:MAG: hypothetical protein M3R59_02680 [Verrucomicrobiota bacterium]|nr:hypothetical protein [Verrucomicrobiota bacterium]